MIQSSVFCQSINVHASSCQSICLSNREMSAFVFLYLLSLFPPTFPVTTWYSMHLFLSTCLKKLHCLFTICFINYLSVWVLLNTFSFVTFFIHEIFIILRKKHISATTSCFFIAWLIVHVSHPYINVLHP